MREKLIELLENSPYLDVLGGLSYYEEAADHLIANGVRLEEKQATSDETERWKVAALYFRDKAYAKPEWIPVTERLPEDDGDYLVAKKIFNNSIRQDVLRFAKDGRKVDKYDFQGEWKNIWYYYDSEYGYITVDSVTHWMPLPEPPEEVNGND
jgi:hypothetical protein